MNLRYLAQEGALIQQELGFVILLSIAALVAIFVRRIRLPYTVALVLVGLLLSLFPNLIEFEISSELILALLVPPLLFEATLHLPWGGLRRDLLPVLLLALVGTLIGTFIVGGMVQQILNIPWAAAIAFGALISATDPVAVIAFFRSLGVSKRLTILVEGESLFNDGVAIVIFNIAVAAGAASANGGTTYFSLSEALLEFIMVAFGGLAVGLVLGYIVSSIILKNVDDHLIETATTVALAFGAFLMAEAFGELINVPGLHLSGILAVVAAGLMVGNIGSYNTSPTTKITLNNFWEFLTFVVNSLVFLLIGIRIAFRQLTPNLVPILVAVLAILVSRAIIVYALGWLNGRLQPRNHIPTSYRHVMFWGGLRGAISLALALTLTDTFSPELANELQVMTFGVVLFTLLVQGLSIEQLIKRLGLGHKSPQQVEQQRQQTLLYTKQAGKTELARLRQEGILSPEIWEAMDAVYDADIVRHKADLSVHLQQFPELEQAMYLQARLDMLRAEKSALADAAQRGLVGEEVQHALARQLNDQVAALELIQANRGLGDEKE
ncbi:MAG: Na+/H+ antiporter [Ardenticatenaceae bacterium]|nr:Na+/H+ antiporter [Ardenticatenaceae bacterium]